MTIAYVNRDVAYLPLPNEVEVIITDELAPRDLTATAFVLPMFSDGSFLLANHQKRGIEIPGGHIEGDETYEQAAMREAGEEVGAVVCDLVPIGYLRQIVQCDKPEDYHYPHPVSYQQFFAGRIAGVREFEPTDECAVPFRCHDLNDRRIQRITISLFGEAARRRLSVA